MLLAVIEAVVDLPHSVNVLEDDRIWVWMFLVHVEDNVNGPRPLQPQTLGRHRSKLVPSLRRQPVCLSAPSHHGVDRSSVESVLHRCGEFGAMCNAGSCSALGEPLADLCHASSASCCGIDADVSKDIVMCWITRLQQTLESLCSFFGAGDEAGLVGIEPESSLSEVRPQSLPLSKDASSTHVCKCTAGRS